MSGVLFLYAGFKVEFAWPGLLFVAIARRVYLHLRRVSFLNKVHRSEES